LVYTVSAITDTGLISAVVDTDDTLDLSFVLDAFGSAQVTVRATDPDGLFTEDTFRITVISDNDAPTVATPISDLTVSEDAAAVLNHADLNAVFADVDNADSQLTYLVTTNTGAGIVTTVIEADDTLDLSFAANAFGIADVTVRATDPEGKFAEDTFRVTVSPINDTPTVANAIADLTVNEDAGPQLNYASLNAVFSDIDNSDNDLVYTVSANTNTGLVSAVVDTNDTLDLSFLADSFGIADVTVQATDPDGLFAEYTFRVTVNSGNDAPTVATPISDLAVNEDAAAVLNHADLNAVFADVDNDGSELTYEVTVNTGAGIVTTVIEADGTLDLSFAANAFGIVDVTVRATDPSSLFAEDSFQVTVNPVNDAPTVANAISDLTVDEDSAPVLNHADLNDVFTDIDNSDNDLVYTVSAITDTGLISAVVDTTDDTLDLSFLADSFGIADVTVRATDPDGLFAEDTFHIIVISDNDAPTVAAPISDLTVNEDAAAVLNHADLNAVFSDVDNDESQLTYLVTVNTGAGIVTTVIEADGTLDLSFAANAFGIFDVTVQATDPEGKFAEDTFRVTVISDNDAPTVAAPISDLTVNEDAAAVLNHADLNAIFADVDNDGSELTYLVITNTGAGIVTTVIEADGTLDLSFAANAFGTADVTVRATDPSSLFAVDTFRITVTSVNDAPTFSLLDNQTVDADVGSQTVTGFLTDVFAGPGNETSQTLSLSVSNDNNGLFSTQPSVNLATGALTYTPATNADGTATVTVTLVDDGGTANGGVDETSLTFTITVNPVSQNEDPIFAVDDQYSAEVFTQLVVDMNSGVLGNDTGPILVPLVVTTTGTITTSEGATVVINADGTFTYDATSSGSLMGLAEGVTLDDSFDYEISDGDGGVDTATVTVTVAGASNNSVHLVDSPLGDGTQALVIRGSGTNDKIDIKMGSMANTFKIHIKTGSMGGSMGSLHGHHHHHHGSLHGPMHGSIGEHGSFHMGTFKFDESADSVSKIIVYGLDGNDNIKVHKNIGVMAWLFGGNGDDKLRGGDQDDVIVGGEGNDKLDGKAGRDILIGGNGADKLKGQKDEDILIAASTTFDSNLAALCGIHQEWRSDNSFEDRVKNIYDGSGVVSGANDAYFFDNATVAISDGAKDVLDGGRSGSDWLIADAEEDKIKKLEVDDIFGLDMDWFNLD
ncbi:MAG: hypothetical protein COA78_05585, partial [Blastopirellula sp.]